MLFALAVKQDLPRTAETVGILELQCHEVSTTAR